MTYKELKQSGKLTCSYINGDYGYNKDRVCYLIRNGDIIASGDWVFSYVNKDYEYIKDGKIYRYNRNHELLDEEYKVIYPIQYNPLIKKYEI